MIALPKPTEIAARMGSALFLPGAPHKAESEQAAALIIVTCAEVGDKWRAVKPKEIGAFVKARESRDEWSVFKSPFFRPDFWGLESDGYAKFGEASEGQAREISLTDIAIRRCAFSVGIGAQPTEPSK